MDSLPFIYMIHTGYKPKLIRFFHDKEFLKDSFNYNILDRNLKFSQLNKSYSLHI